MNGNPYATLESPWAGRRPRVLHLISSLEVGGAECLLADLLEAAHDGPRAELFYAVINNRFDAALRDRLAVSGATGWFLERPEGEKKAPYVKRLRRIIRQRGIDILHAHNAAAKHWGYLLKMLCPGLRLFYTVHATGVVTRCTGASLWLHRRLVNGNIAISRAVQADCQRVKLPRTTLVYNGVDIRRYTRKPAIDAANPPFGMPVRLLNVARMVPEIKGQDTLLRAVKICRGRGFHVEVDLVGDTGGDSADAARRLQDLAAELGLEAPAVRFLGLRGDVPALLPGYDGYVCASRREGLGLSLIEAMLSGIPVVAPDVDGPAELIGGGARGYLFESGSPEDLAETLCRVFAPGFDTRPAVDAARAYAESFDIRRMAAAYNALYHLAPETPLPHPPLTEPLR